MSHRKLYSPVLLICDLQTRFRPTIHAFPSVLATAQRALAGAALIDIPVLATTQERAKLGPTCDELRIDESAPVLKQHYPAFIDALRRRDPATPAVASTLTAPPALGTAAESGQPHRYRFLGSFDKTSFSMAVPPVRAVLSQVQADAVAAGKPAQLDIALVGIESHVCITQTALDFLADGHRVTVIADGVSSGDAKEREWALKRLAHAGAVVTSAESWLFECITDPETLSPDTWKAYVDLIKNTRNVSKKAWATL